LRNGQIRPKAGCERKGFIYGQALKTAGAGFARDLASIDKGEKMRKIKLIVLFGVTLGLLTFGWNMPGIALAEPQTKCPVMRGKIDEKFFVDYKGKRIYFCCSGCIEEFNKDPAKYLKKMEEEGVTPAKTP